MLESEWNHNTHYHSFLLKEIPVKHDSALDIGSGLGLFSFKLALKFNEVVSLEPDRKSLEFSKAKCYEQENIKFIHDSFIEHGFDGRQFDFISAIASIHHMDFEKALRKMEGLLKPGGKIIILGLYKESSLVDFLISLIAIIPNFIRNILSSKNKETGCEMITTFPDMTIKEIKQLSHKILGRYRFKRHLFWRYSIVYEKIK